MPRKVTKRNMKKRSSKKYTRRKTRGNQEGGSVVAGLGAVMVGGMTFMTVYPFAVLWGIQKMFGAGFPKKIKKEQTDDIECEAFLENFETVKKYLATKAVATSGYGVLVSELKSLRTDLAIDGFLGGDNFKAGGRKSADGEIEIEAPAKDGNSVVIDGVKYSLTDLMDDEGKSRSDINKIIVREIERKGHNDDRLLGREAKISDFDYDVDTDYCILPVAKLLSGKVRTSIKQSVKDRFNKISHILNKCKHALEVCQLCYIKTRQKSGGGKLPPNLKKAFDVWENERKYGQTKRGKMVAYKLWYKRFRNRAVEFMAIVESIEGGHTLVETLWSPFDYETWFGTAIAAYKRESPNQGYTPSRLEYTKEKTTTVPSTTLADSPALRVPSTNSKVTISFPYYKNDGNSDTFLWGQSQSSDNSLRNEIIKRTADLNTLINDFKKSVTEEVQVGGGKRPVKISQPPLGSKPAEGGEPVKTMKVAPREGEGGAPPVTKQAMSPTRTTKQSETSTKCKEECTALKLGDGLDLETLKSNYIKAIRLNCRAILQKCIADGKRDVAMKATATKEKEVKEERDKENDQKRKNAVRGHGSITDDERDRQKRRNISLGHGNITDAELSLVTDREHLDLEKSKIREQKSHNDAMASIYDQVGTIVGNITSPDQLVPFIRNP